ncbi:MAG TPA: sodium:solute symporter [Candidatus Paceibacterota bacterium]|nr:sodium:solute symporter [Verrucomicrobiota bacterium]HRY48292.1 sodium:solute symporter [Candidatus Paceibacterota bacterium]HSA00056.1 sodium:solute symporter [Candidatus Paceibacterota bacterium]
MHILDWIVIVLYFGLIGWVAWWYGRHQKDSIDYFLAGRNAGWIVIGASIFTSNIGSEHIVGLAGQGASTGFAMAHWELHAWCLIVLAGLFVPFYYKSAVQTIPEFLEKRFSSHTRLVLSCVSLVLYVFTKVSVTVYAGAIVFRALLPDTFGSPENAFWVGAFSTVIITGVYTVFGGMRAIMNTATPQAVIILLGSFIITAIGLTKLGGWGELVRLASENKEQFALWRPLSDPDFPWLGVLMASPIIGLWYWCTDQYIVQRTLSAKDLPTARRGALFGGLLKVWPVLIFLIPGMIGWAMHQKGIIQLPFKMGADGLATTTIDGDLVFPTLVKLLLPPGIRGLIVACLLAALMSSLASLFNSSASLFTVDIYDKFRPNQSPAHLLLVGRIATTAVVGLGIIWIPVMAQVSKGGLYQYLQNVQGYLAPSITAVFFLGLFWKRINATAATWGLVAGFVLGMVKLTLQTFYGKAKLTTPVLFAQIGDFNPYYSTGVLFAISALIMIVIALLTPPPPEEKIRGLTYGSIHREASDEIHKSWDWGNKLLAGSILVIVLGMYLYFSFWLG